MARVKIFVSNLTADVLPSDPVLAYKTPREIIDKFAKWWEVWKKNSEDNPDYCISTISKTLILCICCSIRETTHKESMGKMVEMTPEDVTIIYVHLDGRQTHLRLDDEGEFIDRWPNGFFREHGELLF